MEEKLSKEEVLHVAHLARIKVSDEEIEKYRIQLKELLNEVDKINEVVGYDEEMMITPIKDEALLHSDEVEDQISFEEVRSNIPHTSGSFIEVPKVVQHE